MSRTDYWERIADLAERATVAREEFVPPEDPPDERRATAFLRNGVEPAVGVYVDARSGDDPTQLPPVEHSLLERALNDFLELYARCYGSDVECEFSVREAAEAFVRTHDIEDAAQLLTKVPPGDGDAPGHHPREREDAPGT